MKRLLLVCLLLYSLIGCSQEAESQEKDGFQDSKEIASVTCKTVSFLTEEVVYDSQELTGNIWHSGNYTLEYDQENRVETLIRYAHGPEGVFEQSRLVMHYNEEDEFVGYTDTYGGGFQVKLTYETDDQGRLVRDGKYVDATTKYIDNGEVIETDLERHILDDMNRVVGLILDNKDVITYFYDADNRPIKVKRAIQIMDSDEVKTIDYDFSYNSQGDLALMTGSGYGGDQEFRYEYQYDEYGNWTQRKTLSFGDHKYITTREITYRD